MGTLTTAPRLDALKRYCVGNVISNVASLKMHSFMVFHVVHLFHINATTQHSLSKNDSHVSDTGYPLTLNTESSVGNTSSLGPIIMP